MNRMNHETYKSEVKRLEKIWRKDKVKFIEEIEKFNL